jgi:hypothetical protein
VSVSQLVARAAVAGVPLPVIDARLVLDEGWSPRCAATLTVPWTQERADALDPRDLVRITLGVERRWSGSLTLDDLSDRWYVPATPPATLLRTNRNQYPRPVGAVGWFFQNGGGTAGTAITNTATDGPQGRHGYRTVTLTTGGTGAFIGHYVRTPVPAGAAGEHVPVSAWVRVSRATTMRLQGTPRIGAAAAGASTSGPYVPVPANTWTLLTLDVVTTAAYDGMQVWPQPPSTETWLPGHTLDAGSVMVGATGPYFDGATPDTAALDYAWTGTANASASTETSIYDPGTTLDDLTAAWAGLTLDDLSTLWGQDWGNGVTRPIDVVTADLILRERTVDHVAATIALRATSDELMAQDARAHVVRPVEPLPTRLTELLTAGHVPIGPPPDVTAGAPYIGMAAQDVEWSQTIWDAMSANANSVGLRLWCDQGRVWRLGPTDAAPTTTVDLTRVQSCTDAVDRDGDYADAIVWLGKGINPEGLPLTETKTWPLTLPVGPYKAHLEEHDYGQTGVGLPMPSDEELARRLAVLQSRDRVLTITAPADPTVRPGMGVLTGAPSLPGTTSVVARVEWAVPADIMTITTRATLEV